jgi:hypothetical protein
MEFDQQRGEIKPVECSLKKNFSPDLQVKSDGPFVAFAGLELNRVTFIEVFYLIARRHAPPVKENLFATIIRSDEPKTLWSDNLFDSAGHNDFSFNVANPISFHGDVLTIKLHLT